MTSIRDFKLVLTIIGGLYVLMTVVITRNLARARVSIIVAAVLGACAAAPLVRTQAKACSCADHEWNLRLVETEEPTEGVWPDRAVLAISDSYDLKISSSVQGDAQIDIVRVW